jgi:hypothetical protein
MIRSASSSRWCGLTVHLEIEQPPKRSAAPMRISPVLVLVLVFDCSFEDEDED